jgi:hypothetical protein
MSDTELAGLPEGGPASMTATKVMLSIDATDVRDDAELSNIVAAVNAEVRTWPVSTAAVGAAAWPANLERGAHMLAARLFRRRNSPAGVESFGSLGAAYVMRTDPDIAMLLKLGSWQRPGLG